MSEPAYDLQVEGLLAENARLRARIAKLEKELNPFAAIADRAEEMGFKADNSVLYVTLGPCRRARTVLDAGREKG